MTELKPSLAAGVLLTLAAHLCAAPLVDQNALEHSAGHLDEAQDLLAQGRTGPAMLLLHRLINADPTDLAARRELARACMAEHPLCVRTQALAITEQRPGDQEALDLLGLAYRQMRAAAGTTREREIELRAGEVADYQRVLEGSPNWPEALFRSATHRIALERLDPSRSQELDKAVGELGQLIAALPANAKTLRASALHQLGRAWKHKGDRLGEAATDNGRLGDDYQQALQAFESSIALDPARIDALGEIVLLLRAAGRAAEALPQLRTALARSEDPRHRAKLQEMIGELELAQGRADAATQALGDAVALDPRRLGAALQLARTQRNKGNLTEAIKLLRATLGQEPRFLEGRIELGYTLLAAGHRAEAIGAWEVVMRSDPARARFLGMVPSKNLYRNKLYQQTAAWLAWMYLEDGNPSRALRAAHKAETFAPADAALDDTKAWAHHQLGNHERARALLEPHIGDDASALRRYHLAAIYAGLGRDQDALVQLDKALADDAPFSAREQAEQLRRQLRQEPVRE